MSAFLDRLAAHAQGTAPVLRIRPRARFEEAPPEPIDEVVATVTDEIAYDEPAALPERTDRMPESRPVERPVEAAVHRPAPTEEPTADRQPKVNTPTVTAPPIEAAPPPPEQAAITHETAAPAIPMRPPPADPPAAPVPDPVPPPAAPVARRPPRRRATAEIPPTHEPEQNHPASSDVRWPATAEVGQRVTAALRDAGLLAPAAGRDAPAVRWPEETFPPETDLAGRLAADPAEPSRRGQDVHLHVHLDRVEVLHPAPPAPAPAVRRADPPAPRRPASSVPVDHDAYLARRRENRR